MSLSSARAVLFSRCVRAFALMNAAFFRARFHRFTPRLGLLAKSYCELGRSSSSSTEASASTSAAEKPEAALECAVLREDEAAHHGDAPDDRSD